MKLTLTDPFTLENSLMRWDMTSLVQAYTPLMGKEALFVYLSLGVMANHSEGDLNRLCQDMQLDLIHLNTALEALFRVQLVSLNVQKQTHHLHIQVLAPLRMEAVLKHDVLGRALLKKVGAQRFEALRSPQVSNSVSLDGFEPYQLDKHDMNLTQWSEKEEATFKGTVSKEMALDLRFDIKAFLQACSPLIFPLKKRSEEALRAIVEIGSVYGLSVDQMVALVGKSYIENEASLNIDRLRKLAAKETIEEEMVSSDPYDCAPALFLKRLRKGLEPTSLEKYLLVKLVRQDGLSPIVLNVLVEDHFKRYKEKINTKVLEEQAMQWAVQNIRTLEEAQKNLYLIKGPKRRVEASLDYEPTQSSLSEQEQEAIKQALRSLK